jgi:hypothetical protein
MKWSVVLPWAALVTLLVIMAFTTTCTVWTSDYRPITTTGGDAKPDMFKLPIKQECIPSSTNEKGAYYTGASGGLCGDQQYIQEISREYAITDGIGGSLLSQ